MTNKRLENFSNFIFDFSDDDIQLIKEELEEAGINLDKSRDSMLQQIEKAKINLKIEKGKKLYQDFINALTGLHPNHSTKAFSDIRLQAAFRKLEKELSPEELRELINDNKKLDILEKLINTDEQLS